MEEQDVLADLIVESREHLQKIEPDLLSLERKGSAVDDELINRVFRAVHSIKGGFGFFGIKSIVSLSHLMETVIAKVRDKALPVTPELVEALLRGIDKLRVMVDDVTNAESVSFDEERELLDPFTGKAAPAEPGAPKEKKKAAKPAKASVRQEQDPLEYVLQHHTPVTEAQCTEAIKSGRLLYLVTPDTANLRGQSRTFAQIFGEWEKVGTVVDCNPPRATIESLPPEQFPQEVSVVFCTVLETDLAVIALGLDAERVRMLEADKLRAMLREGRPGVPDATAGRKTSQDPSPAAAPLQLRKETAADDTLRVKVDLLNSLMNFAGELVLARNQLMLFMTRRFAEFETGDQLTRAVVENARAMCARIAAIRTGTDPSKAIDLEIDRFEKQLKTLTSFPLTSISGMTGLAQNINLVTTSLQESIMQTRLQPLSVVFSRFPRLVRDLAKKLGKEIELTQIGQDVELDKSIIEMLSDPLIHLVRNCADHGIEHPREREKAGKPGQGILILKAHQEGGKVIIDIIDDGAGIDAGRVRAKAVEKGVLTQEKAAAMSDKEALSLIFAPGFSTASEVTDVSGRGVGMDVVKTSIERLGGTVELLTELGQGTTVTLRLPLTLAIIPSLIVSAEGRRFAVPQAGLEELVRIRSQDITGKIERIGGAEVLRLRGKLLPLVRLSTALGISPTFVHPENGARQPDNRNRWSDRRGTGPQAAQPELQAPGGDNRMGASDRRTSLSNAVKIIVLRMEKNRFGLVVDDVLDSEEIVVKPLPEYLKASQCYGGATIMGDGSVAMILDPNGLATMASLRLEDLEKEMAEEKERTAAQSRTVLENILLFSLGGPELLGVNLSTVARIEKRRASEIERVGDIEVLKYDESTLRILRLDRFLPVTPGGEEASSLYVLVPRNARKPIGFVATRVIDAVQTSLQTETHSVAGPGLRGTALINKRMTVLLDMPSLLQRVEAELG